MNAPEVSALMSVFNVEEYVSQAIESVVRQTFTDWELIIVDDGSTDDTWPIITAWAERDARIIARRNERNLGTSGALNKALALSRGQFITRQDGDDISEPERLAEQLSFLQQRPEIGAVGTAVLRIDAAGRPLEISSFPRDNDQIQATLLDYMCFCGPTVMVRRSVYETAGFYFDGDLSYSEDYDLCLRLAEATRMANLDRPLYQYRQHAHSVSYSRRHQQMRRKAQALALALERRFGRQPPPDKLYLVARDYLRAAIVGYQGRQPDGARDCLDRSLLLYPTLLHKGDLLEGMVRRYARDLPAEAALTFMRSLFEDLLPQSWPMARSKRRLLAECHIQELFKALDRGERRQVENHLWPAIRLNPTWLLNRGVLSLSIKALLHLDDRS